MDTDRLEGRMARREARRGRHGTGTGGIVIGGLIVGVGLLLLLENMGVLYIHDIWRYWPVALVAMGVARIVESQRPAALAWGGTIALIGALLLLRNLDLFYFNFNMIWPLLIIAFGVSMLLRSMERERMSSGGEQVTTDPMVSLYAVFSGARRRFNSQEFTGGEIFAVFSGVHLDLRGARLPQGKAVIDANAVFAGIEIFVPEGWNVKTKGMGIFGGFEDKTVPPRATDSSSAPELTITGSSLFGGVSVRN